MARRKKLQAIDPLDEFLGRLKGIGQQARLDGTIQVNDIRLFHYTSSEGFRGIVSSNSLRFSDPLFLNDGSEVYYANRLFRETLDAFLVGRSRSERVLAEKIRDMIVQTAFQFRPVIFCMSGTPDLLNQWRDYGRDIVPYCFELDVVPLLQEDWSFPCHLVKMVYDRDEQVRILTDLISGVFEVFGDLHHLLKNRHARSMIFQGIVSEVWGALVYFKNPSFRAEDEWRLLGHTAFTEGQQVEFRSSNLGIVPYLSRYPRVSPRIPIKKVWIGPSPYGHLSQLALQRFLASYHHDCPTEVSEIPAR